MSEWKHDRSYYRKLADKLAKWAIVSFGLLIASLAVWIMKFSQIIYLCSTLFFLLLFILIISLSYSHPLSEYL